MMPSEPQPARIQPSRCLALFARSIRGETVAAISSGSPAIKYEGEASTGSRSQLVWVSLLVDSVLQGDVAQAAADDRLRLGLTGGSGG